MAYKTSRIFPPKFQFKYCAIKRPLDFLSCLTKRLFQFKYCAIKSSIIVKGKKGYTIFQFKYCAIKRRKTITNHLKQTNFNSSIVRLRDKCVSGYFTLD